MENKRSVLTALALAVLFMASCSLIGVLRPASASAANATATAIVQPTFNQPTQPVRQATNIPATPLLASETPAATLVISTPISLASTVPCDQAVLVADVSAPDGTIFHPNDTVVKTWRLMNAGSCTWTTAYQLLFDRGYDFMGARTVNLAKSVAPGETADISLRFPAPTMPGNYESVWNLQDPAGTIFGTGPAGDVPLVIRISVIP